MDTQACIRMVLSINMKDVGIRIRVEKGLREAFVAACQEGNRRSSDVLREFMRAYVERYRQGQRDLFAGEQSDVKDAAIREAGLV